MIGKKSNHFKINTKIIRGENMPIRYNPSYKYGLTKEQVDERYHDNLVNYDTSIPTKTIKEIITSNIFNLFNILNFVLAFLIALTGSYKNLLFLGVVFCNTIIGIIQEIRAKKEIDKLSIIANNKVHVIRYGKKIDINIDEIVLDDILELNSGDQVITDSIIINGECEIDESFITGETVSIYKQEKDMIRSGSFIVSGKVYAKCEHIGSDNYTAKISEEAKYKKKNNSVLMNSLNTIIKYISIIIIPIGLILFFNQLNIPHNTVNQAIINTVAAILGMIPEGLILLTSTVLTVSIIRLSKYKVLVKDLYAVESLARIDTICLDKTGTITEGKMEVTKVIPMSSFSKNNVNDIMGAICTASSDNNPTMIALKNKFTKPSKNNIIKFTPFSSKLKYSSFQFENNDTYYLGALEIIAKNDYKKIEKSLSKDLEKYRIIALGKQDNNSKKIKLVALIYLQDKLRKNISETISYLKKQKIDIKVISGDNVKTIMGVAKRAGIENYDKYIDMSSINNENLDDICNKYTIFGRVNPEQKRELIKALKRTNHYVAMTGDGVNDVLSLKEADCSIAIPSGSDAAKYISKLVLLDSDFKSIPKVIDEGRRTINNIEKSATLFLCKTSYATILAILFIFLNTNYPFMPIQFTLTSVATIGIPSFVLALQPNKNKLQGNFFKNVLSKSLPTAFLVVLNVISITFIGPHFNLSSNEITTLCVLMNAYTGFLLLYYLSIPFNNLKRILFISMIIFFILQFILLKDLYSLSFITITMLIISIMLSLLTLILFKILTSLLYKELK